MESEEFEACVEFCLDLKLNGKEFDEIRTILRSKEVSEEDIKEVIKETDNQFLSELIEVKPANSNAFILIGWTLISFGVFITLYTYIMAVSHGGGFYILMYGPIISGLVLVSYRPRRKKPSVFDESKRNKWQRNF